VTSKRILKVMQQKSMDGNKPNIKKSKEKEVKKTS
jgi:hypothetical protein